MKPVITPENELLAKEFMQYIAITYEKRLKRFKFQLAKHRVSDDLLAEDVFTDTLIKCQDRICREGLPEGKHFGAYFDRATENNLVQYQMKTKNQGTKHVAFEPVPVETSLFDLDVMESYKHCASLPQYVTEVEAFADFDADQYPSDDQRHLARVLGQFEQLPDKYKEVLCMVADGLRYREIGRALNLRRDQVKMRILTARNLVKEALRVVQYLEDESDFLDDYNEGYDHY
jgi:RNA polymerase sigma factor (sigma-70 family)